MNREDSPPRIRLNEEGELLDGVFCQQCGHLNYTPGQACEQCGKPFPEPFSPLRLRLEALRRSDGKQKDITTSQPSIWRFCIWVTIISLTLSFILAFCILAFFGAR